MESKPVDVAIAKERERCALLVEAHIQTVEPKPILVGLLRRIANLIRSGATIAQPLAELGEPRPESREALEVERPEAGGVSESGTPPTPGP